MCLEIKDNLLIYSSSVGAEVTNVEQTDWQKWGKKCLMGWVSGWVGSLGGGAFHVQEGLQCGSECSQIRLAFPNAPLPF